MAAAGVYLLHLYKAISQSSNDICSVVQMACLVLVELGHGCESIGNTSAVDNRPKGLGCRCICLEQSYFGVANSNHQVSLKCSSSDA
jgi:hypothetical protein